MRQTQGLRLRFPLPDDFQIESWMRALTVELTGRPEEPNQATPAHTVFGAGGADIEAVHGPVQRLLEPAFIEATVRARQMRCNERRHGDPSPPARVGLPAAHKERR